jgi:hypothetical protein
VAIAGSSSEICSDTTLNPAGSRGNQQRSLPIWIVEQLNRGPTSEVHSSPLEPCEHARIGPSIPENGDQSSDKLLARARGAAIMPPTLELSHGHSQQLGEVCDRQVRKPSFQKRNRLIGASAKSTRMLLLQQVAQDVADRFKVDQVLVGSIKNAEPLAVKRENREQTPTDFVGEVGVDLGQQPLIGAPGGFAHRPDKPIETFRIECAACRGFLHRALHPEYRLVEGLDCSPLDELFCRHQSSVVIMSPCRDILAPILK